VSKVVLITGGARGQGASHAERLAGDGARVVIADVLDDAGEAVAARLRGAGLVVHYEHLDVTSPDGWARVVAAVESRHGQLDVLVNNAGIVHVTSVADETLDAWNAVMAVNATGVFLGMRAAIPTMRRGGAGSIINVSSIFGVVGAVGYVAYAASKAAVIAMTKTAALELAADGIRVNAICPGGVSTAMNEDEGTGVVPLTPMGRRANVREISGAVAFLASDDAAFITGTELVVDGGFLAH